MKAKKEALNRLCWKEKIANFAAFSCTIHEKITSSLSLFVLDMQLIMIFTEKLSVFRGHIWLAAE